MHLRPLIAGLALALVAACAGSSPSGISKVHADDRLPSQNLNDWTSYGDHVVLATVKNEAEVRQPGDVNSAGEGITSRTVTLQLDRRIWSRAGAPQVPATFSMTHDGWIIRNSTERSTYMTGDVRLTAGESYLLVLTSYPEGWGTLGSASFGTTDGTGRLSDGDWSNAAFSGLEGKSPEEVAVVLGGTAPDSIALKYFNLPAIERYAAVIKERQSSGG